MSRTVQLLLLLLVDQLPLLISCGLLIDLKVHKAACHCCLPLLLLLLLLLHGSALTLTQARYYLSRSFGSHGVELRIPLADAGCLPFTNFSSNLDRNRIVCAVVTSEKACALTAYNQQVCHGRMLISSDRTQTARAHGCDKCHFCRKPLSHQLSYPALYMGLLLFVQAQQTTFADSTALQLAGGFG
jgi:hypothetical protein